MVYDLKTILTRPIVPQVVCLSLMLLILVQLTISIMDFVTIDKRMPVVHDETMEVRSVQNETLSKGPKIAFFGEYVPTNLNEANVKQSMLGFTVVGVMFSEHENASHVIIKVTNDHERTFKVGDSLPGGAVIKRITPDGVLILRNGALESLSLPKKDFNLAPPPKPLKFSD